MKEITKEQEERLLLYATYTILYLNDSACFSIQQIGKDVKDKDKESQKIYGALLKRNSTYLGLISLIVDKNMDYFCDYCTGMDEICDNAYEEFKSSLCKTYKEAGLDDYEYMAKVETMRSMVEMSVEAGKRIIGDIRSHLPKVSYLERYLLIDMMRVANNFSDWSYRKVDKNTKIEFNEESNVMVKFRKLSECLIDYNSFDKAYRNAVRLEIERKKEKDNE